LVDDFKYFGQKIKKQIALGKLENYKFFKVKIYNNAYSYPFSYDEIYGYNLNELVEQYATKGINLLEIPLFKIEEEK